MDMVKEAQLSGWTLEKVVVHPLLLLSIVDHYNCVACDTRKRVIGVLLGTFSRGVVDVTNSYAVHTSTCGFFNKTTLICSLEDMYGKEGASKTKHLLAKIRLLEEERNRNDLANRTMYDLFVSMCEKNGQTPPSMPVIAPAGTLNSRQASTNPSPSATGATGPTPTPTPL